MHKLKIAMLAPLKRPITEDATAARPRVMMDLISELVKKGHVITVLGTGDSIIPGAKLIPITPKGLSLMPAAENPFYQHTAYLTLMISKLVKTQTDFDLVHNHMYPEFLPLLVSLQIPMLTTVHSQMTPETILALKQFPQAHVVTISHAAKRASGIESAKVAHNGIDTDLFISDNQTKKDYLLFVGRMSKARDKQGKFLDPKGVQNAIAVAQKANTKLKIVGNVEDPKFFTTLVKPHLDYQIEFVDKVSQEQIIDRHDMVRLFQGAKALIFPINWEEPFGLVMVESMACGTPVIAYNRGSVPEVVVDGITGFVVEPELRNLNHLSNLKIQKPSIDGLVEAVRRLDEINRKKCREHVVAHFSKSKMAEEYERLYKQLLNC